MYRCIVLSGRMLRGALSLRSQLSSYTFDCLPNEGFYLCGSISWPAYPSLLWANNCWRQILETLNTSCFMDRRKRLAVSFFSSREVKYKG